MSSIQFIQVTPEQLKEEILKGVKSQLNDFKEIFEAKNSTEYMTIKEVCSLIKVHKTTLWKYTNEGKLKSYGIGDRVLYKRNEVEEALIQLNK